MRRSRGFTLLEVLVSFVLLAAASALLLGMLSGGLRQVSRARAETEASLLAQSTLDQLGVLLPVEAGAREGEYPGGRYRYRMEIAPVDDPAPAPADPVTAPADGGPAAPRPVLFRVALDVRWGDAATQVLHVATLRARLPEQDIVR
jgi:general secretion pathway protein I